MATESPLLTVAPPTPPTNGIASVVVSEEPTPPKPSWFSANLRNLMALAMTGMVCYLAYIGEQTARGALVAAFSVLAGAIWGERAALKNPSRSG